MNKRQLEKTKALISWGAPIAGSVAGAVASYLARDVTEAAAGDALGVVLTRTLQLAGDFALRHLTRRERIKAGAGLKFAYDKIVEYVEAGRESRDDGFFDPDASGRSESDEILEGTLYRCQTEHEEKKLRYIGNVYANMAFTQGIPVSGANWLLQRARDLTYRQLCMIALVARGDVQEVSWGPHDGDPAFQAEYEQIDYMFTRDHSQAVWTAHDEIGERPPVTGLSRVGEFCHELMGLSEIPRRTSGICNPISLVHSHESGQHCMGRDATQHAHIEEDQHHAVCKRVGLGDSPPLHWLCVVGFLRQHAVELWAVVSLQFEKEVCNGT